MACPTPARIGLLYHHGSASEGRHLTTLNNLGSHIKCPLLAAFCLFVSVVAIVSSLQESRPGRSSVPNPQETLALSKNGHYLELPL